MIYVFLPKSICFDTTVDLVHSKNIYFYMQKTNFCEKTYLTQHQHLHFFFMARGEWEGLENIIITLPQMCSVV